MNSERTKGIIDLHIHSAPDIRQRKMNDIELMEAGVRLGAKIVWLPTNTSSNHFSKSGKNSGVEVLKNGKVTDEVKSVFELVKDHNAVLAVGNIFAVVCGAILNAVGKRFPKISGGNKLLRDEKATMETEKEDKKEKVSVDDIAAGIFLTAGFFVLGSLMSCKILPSIFGVKIPSFAYLIVFTAIANIFNLIPDHLKQGAKNVSSSVAVSLSGYRRLAVESYSWM